MSDIKFNQAAAAREIRRNAQSTKGVDVIHQVTNQATLSVVTEWVSAAVVRQGILHVHGLDALGGKFVWGSIHSEPNTLYKQYRLLLWCSYEAVVTVYCRGICAVISDGASIMV